MLCVDSVELTISYVYLVSPELSPFPRAFWLAKLARKSMWLRAQAMHSFFHRDNVALPGFSAMFKVCPTWLPHSDTAY